MIISALYSLSFASNFGLCRDQATIKKGFLIFISFFGKKDFYDLHIRSEIEF